MQIVSYATREDVVAKYTYIPLSVVEGPGKVIHPLERYGVLAFCHHNARIVACRTFWVQVLVGAGKCDLASKSKKDTNK